MQRFASYEDLDRHNCSIEEREEYEPHLVQGAVVYAGVDYEAILREAEKEVDIVPWDGGNNDLPFIKSDLSIVVVDPHRPGDELSYHPGDVLPAMGYGSEQMDELEKTINATDAELVGIGTPIDLGKLLNLDKPYQNVRYELEEIGQPRLPEIHEARFGRGP